MIRKLSSRDYKVSGLTGIASGFLLVITRMLIIGSTSVENLLVLSMFLVGKSYISSIFLSFF